MLKYSISVVSKRVRVRVCASVLLCVCVRVLYFLILFVVAVRLWCLPRDQSQVRERVGEGDDGDGSSSSSNVDVDSDCGSEADLLPRALTIRMFHVSILLFYFLYCSFRVSFFDADQIVRLSALLCVCVCAFVSWLEVTFSFLAFRLLSIVRRGLSLPLSLSLLGLRKIRASAQEQFDRMTFQNLSPHRDHVQCI